MNAVSDVVGSRTGPEAFRAEATHAGILTVCVMLATIMQALDATIANVALPYMQGSLSASLAEVNWVLTSYIVAAAIMTPPTGFLAGRFGRKRLFLASVAGFTLARTTPGVARIWAMLEVHASRSASLCSGPSGSRRNPSPRSSRGTSKSAGTNGRSEMSMAASYWHRDAV